MAKTFDMGIYDVTFLANEDLSGYQYFPVCAASVQNYVKLATGTSNPAPIGVIQTDTASLVGDPVAVRLFGPTKAWVAAATSALTACDVDAGDYLSVAGAGSAFFCWTGVGGPAAARALDFLDTGCALINVFFLGFATCDAGNNSG